MGHFALPVRDGQEYGHDQGGNQLQIVGVQTQLQDHLQHKVVDYGTQGYGKHLQTEVLEDLAEGHFTDDNGSQADNNGAAPHAHIGRALELGQQTTGQGHQTVGKHQTQNDIGVGVDALGPGHVGIGAGSADRAASLCAEEPVQGDDRHNGDDQQQRQGIADRQIPHIPLGNSQIVLIHAYGLVGLAAHDPQVHGVQGELRENTGQDGGNTALGVKQARNQARQQAGNKGAQQSQPAVHAASNQHHGYSAAGGNGAVHGQVGHIQHTEGDVHTDGHDAPYKALCRRAGQRIQK